LARKAPLRFKYCGRNAMPKVGTNERMVKNQAEINQQAVSCSNENEPRNIRKEPGTKATQ
jgi:hypothetical protein